MNNSWKLHSTKLYKTIFGYDIFISYSRIDSLDYAYAIAQHFLKNGYECFIDQLSSSTPGKELPETIEGAVKNSTAFVLIGSIGSEASIPIKKEIQSFLLKNKNQPLIPITIDNAISTDCIWFSEIDGLALIDDTSENLKNGSPSDDVLNRIESALKFTKKSKRLRVLAISILVAIMLIISGTIIYISKTVSDADTKVKKSNRLADTAILKERNAKAETIKANSEKKIADSLKAVALSEKKIAEEQKDDALKLKSDAEKSAYSSHLVALSSNSDEIPNKYFAVDTAIKAYSLQHSKLSFDNLCNLFLQYPFIYGTHLRNLDVPFHTLGFKKDYFYLLENSKISKVVIQDNGKFRITEKLKFDGFPNIVKDNIVASYGDKELNKWVVDCDNDLIKSESLPNTTPVYLSEENLMNNRFIHEETDINTTIEFSYWDGAEHFLNRINTQIQINDTVSAKKLLAFENDYYLFLELQQNTDDVDNNITRIKLIKLNNDFSALEYYDITVDLAQCSDYNLRDLKGMVRYENKGQDYLIMIYRNAIKRFSLTEGRERNGIEISKDYTLNDFYYLKSKTTLLLQNGPIFGVYQLKDLDTNEMLKESYVLNIETEGYQFYPLNDNYVMLIIRYGEIYFYDINFNPDDMNHRYISAEEIIDYRKTSKQKLFKFFF